MQNTISGYVSYGGLRSCIVDLLYGLLKFDPEERPSAEEALDNPFFRNTHAMLNRYKDLKTYGSCHLISILVDLDFLKPCLQNIFIKIQQNLRRAILNHAYSID